MPDSEASTLANPCVIEAIARGFIEITGTRVKYNLNQKREYDWNGSGRMGASQNNCLFDSCKELSFKSP